MKLGQRVLLAIWLCLCTLNIVLWPRNRFEWMLSEPNGTKDGLTFCSLPLDPDASFGALLAVAPVLVTLALGLFLTVRAGKIRPSLVGGLVLLAMWLVRFQLVRWRC